MTAPALEVGKIVRSHGLRGQVVVELWTNRAERMERGTSLGSPQGDLRIVAVTALPEQGGATRWLVSFEGVGSREEAEALRGVVLSAAPIEVEGALWIHELVGSTVVTVAGEMIGTVDAVQANPASDLLVLDSGHLIPLTFVVAQSAGSVTVDLPPGLLDL